MGLGSADSVSLSEARDKAHEASRLLRAGNNPIEVKRQANRIASGIPTFGAAAGGFVAAKSAEWRNKKHIAQWQSSLTDLAAPLRATPVDKIDTAAVLGVLKPMWLARPETASRLRGRIEAVLDAAKAQGYRSGENPAAWRGHLAHLLPRRAKLSRGRLAAMDFREIPSFIARLRGLEGIAALALEFCILTAGRSGEVYGATWGEVDLAARVWVLPPARMKGAREHRVPLSDRAIEILENLRALGTCNFVFPSPRGPKPLSHVAMAKVLTRLGVKGPTVHGFRSAFRDWCGELTDFPREIAEASLAHVVGDKAEQAYRRGDALEKRRKLMESWADYCAAADADHSESDGNPRR
jgi:integrase